MLPPVGHRMNAIRAIFRLYRTKLVYKYIVLLMLASQRIESVVGGWFWGEETEMYQVEAPTKRGVTPSAVEWLILAWVSGKLLYVNVPCTISYFVFDRLNLERGETTVGHWIA